MEEVESNDLTGDVMISNTGCFGICQHGPVMVVYPEGVWYGGLDGDAVIKICEEHFIKGRPVEEYRFCILPRRVRKEMRLCTGDREDAHMRGR